MLSPTIGSLEEALDRISSSASLQYSQLSIQQVYVAFVGNRELCLSFLWHCVDYGEKMFTWHLTSITSPTSSCVGALHDLREWTTELRSKVTGVSAENVASVQGLSSFQSMLLIPVTDRCGYFCLLFTGATKIQNYIQ